MCKEYTKEELFDEVLQILQYYPYPDRRVIDITDRFTKFLYPNWDVSEITC